MNAIAAARRLLPRPARRRALAALEWLQTRSLCAAGREQGLAALADRLNAIVPDLSQQYTSFTVEGRMRPLKVRLQHAFQIALALRAVRLALEAPRAARDGELAIVDLGDSAGTHLTYLKALLAEGNSLGARTLRCLSVNLDPAAVARIRARGLEAVLGRAEDVVEAGGLDADIGLCFEMLEHLTDPIRFLDTLSRNGSCARLLVTVPYLRRSRVGLHHIRRGERFQVSPENTHLFELSSADWKLVFAHAGWAVREEEVYLQHPRRSPWRLLQPAWRLIDFEGFYGAILEPDRAWADLYHA